MPVMEKSKQWPQPQPRRCALWPPVTQHVAACNLSNIMRVKMEERSKRRLSMTSLYLVHTTILQANTETSMQRHKKAVKQSCLLSLHE